jgi:hemolysin III
MFKKLPPEERWNVYTHGFGAIISFIGIVYFIVFSNLSSDKANLGFLIYGFSLIFLFVSSSLYHLETGSQKVKWQKIDHIGIYFLIAGTYTPVCLTILWKTSGLIILLVVWVLTIIGIVYKIFFINKFVNFSLFLYLFMGWLIIFDFENAYSLLSKELLTYLILGGVCYSFGTIFYKWERLNFNHVIWHIFVLLGAALHFVFVVKLIDGN